MELPKIYRTQEVADYLLVDVDTVTKLIRTRELAAKKIGREWRITESDLMEYLESKKIRPRKTG